MNRTHDAAAHPKPPCQAPLPDDSRAWQRRGSTQILCALALVLPMAAIATAVHHLQGRIGLEGMLLGPLLGGGVLIFWILFLHLAVCGDGLDRLGFAAARPVHDVAAGLALGGALLAFHLAFNSTVAGLFEPRPPAPDIVELLVRLARDPWLLALWLGPVAWIGVAFFEELARAFLLRRLWLAWPGAAARWAVIALVSAATGLVHAYQGPAAALSIGVMSVFLGWFYLRTGRILALIVSHGVYDSVQIVLAVVMIRQMGP